MTDRVVELLEEYASCYNKLDPYKVAAEIREAVNNELCPHCGAHLENWKTELRENHHCVGVEK